MELSFARDKAHIRGELRIWEIICKLIPHNARALLAIPVSLMQPIFPRPVHALKALRMDSTWRKERPTEIKSTIRPNCRELSLETLYPFVSSLRLNNLRALARDVLVWCQELLRCGDRRINGNDRDGLIGCIGW